MAPSGYAHMIDPESCEQRELPQRNNRLLRSAGKVLLLVTVVAAGAACMNATPTKSAVMMNATPKHSQDAVVMLDEAEVNQTRFGKVKAWWSDNVQPYVDKVTAKVSPEIPGFVADVLIVWPCATMIANIGVDSYFQALMELELVSMSMVIGALSWASTDLLQVKQGWTTSHAFVTSVAGGLLLAIIFNILDCLSFKK